MKKFHIYDHEFFGHEAVKQGWSWPGFFFTVIWALVKKLWLIAIIVFVGSIVVRSSIYAISMDAVTISIVLALDLLLMIVFGINGNSWRIGNLKKRGYRYVGQAIASNKQGALSDIMREQKS